MTKNQNGPREYDAVLGGKNPPPVNAAVLGGIEGVKRRLKANDELVRVEAVRDAMKYGEAGLEVAIASLKDKSPQVRGTVLRLLEEKLRIPKVRALLGKELRLVKNKIITIYREEFETVTVNARGEIIKRERRQADYFAEDLGDGVKLEMVSIPGGSFLMGSQTGQGFDQERPQHRVNVGSFFLGKYPVTQQQYEAVMGNNPSFFKGANRPVEEVTWKDGIKFCLRLSHKTGKNYRLPSEAEWEYACRANTTTRFYFGRTITTDLANYDCNYTYCSAPKGIRRGQTSDVGSFPPNVFGLYDMHGNVWEWCQDVWHYNYNDAPTDGSAWKSGGISFSRLLRGGSWTSHPGGCRSAFRIGFLAPRHGFKGFRVVLVPGL